MREGVEGLTRDKTRPSRIPALPPETVDRVVALTNQTPPHAATHWTASAMAKAVGISPSSVRRIWKRHGLQPHRVRAFKLSNDPKFAEKLKDVVGLYVDPPAHAVVLSIDEKSQIQALDRTQPGLPMKKGRCATMTHDYKRNSLPPRRRGAPPPCSPPSISLKARSSGAVCSATGIRSSSAFSMPSRTRFRPAKRSTWCSTTTPPTSTQGKSLAEAASALHLPLHPNFLLLGQCGRRVVCQAHPATAQARRVHLNRRASGRHQPLYRRRQRQAQAVRLDEILRRHSRRGPARETSVRSDPLGCSRQVCATRRWWPAAHHRAIVICTARLQHHRDSREPKTLVGTKSGRNSLKVDMLTAIMLGATVLVSGEGNAQQPTAPPA